MSYSLFDHLDDITKNKKDFDNDDHTRVKSYSPYMINRFFSMVDLYIPLVEQVNKFNLPKETHYEYYKSILPKKKHYIKYLKNKKEKKDEEHIIKCICLYYEIGSKEAKQYRNILTEDRIESIVKKYPKSV